MNRLEERYRKVLRLLPADYRQQWEEEMVATFLERMHTGDPEEDEERALFGRPPLGERASVLGLAVRLRFGGTEAPPRSHLWGQGVRLAVLVGFLVLAVGGTWSVLNWFLLPWWPNAPADLVAYTRSPSVWYVVTLAGRALWLVAFVALVGGWRRAAVISAAVAVSLVVADQAWQLFQDVRWHMPYGSDLLGWIPILVDALLVAGLGAFHRDAPRVRRVRPWLAGYLAGVVVTVVVNLGMSLEGPGVLPWVDWWTIWSVAFVVGVVVHLRRGAARAEDPERGAPWSLAMSLLAGAVLLLRTVSLASFTFVGLTWTDPSMLFGFGEALAVLAAGLAVTGATSRAFARLPAPRDPAARPG